MIAHYSFDMWLTLIRSNPLFKLEREKYFYTNWNPSGKSDKKVSEIIRNVDVKTNKFNEETGGNKDVYEMYIEILEQLGVDLSRYHCADLEKIYEKLEDLFFKFPPEFIEPDIKETLLALKEKGKTISVLSNTGFIEGRTMRKFLKLKGLDIFDFQLYSDELKYSKPNGIVFTEVWKQVCILRNYQIEPKHIMHVGDSLTADYQGAQEAGFKPFLYSNKTNVSYLRFAHR